MKLTVTLVDNNVDADHPAFMTELVSALLQNAGATVVEVQVKGLVLPGIHVAPGADVVLRFEE